MAAVEAINGVSGKVFQVDVVSWYLVGDVALLITVAMSTHRGDFDACLLLAFSPPRRKPHLQMVTDDIAQHG